MFRYFLERVLYFYALPTDIFFSVSNPDFSMISQVFSKGFLFRCLVCKTYAGVKSYTKTSVEQQVHAFVWKVK